MLDFNFLISHTRTHEANRVGEVDWVDRPHRTPRTPHPAFPFADTAHYPG